MSRRKRAKKFEPKRSVLIGTRVTPEERIALLRKSVKLDLSLSGYLREQGLKGRVVVAEPANDVPLEVIFQLKKIGTNLNQIAHAMNSGFEPPPELTRLLRLIETYVLEQIINGAPPR